MCSSHCSFFFGGFLNSECVGITLLLLKFWMLKVKIRRVLIRLRHRKQFRLAKQLSDEADARRCSFLREPIRQNNTWMTGEIREKQVVSSEGGRDIHIDILHEFLHLLNHQVSDSVCLDVFNRRDEP